jgi:hypothetical protein
MKMRYRAEGREQSDEMCQLCENYVLQTGKGDTKGYYRTAERADSEIYQRTPLDIGGEIYRPEKR